MNGALLSPDDLPHETVLIPGEFISQHTQTINSDSDTSDTQDLLIEEQEIFSIESAEGVPTLSIQLYPENSSNQSGTLFGQGTGNGEQGKVNTDRTPI
jgi:hypothetical protein